MTCLCDGLKKACLPTELCCLSSCRAYLWVVLEWQACLWVVHYNTSFSLVQCPWSSARACFPALYFRLCVWWLSVHFQKQWNDSAWHCRNHTRLRVSWWHLRAFWWTESGLLDNGKEINLFEMMRTCSPVKEIVHCRVSSKLSKDTKF